MKNYGILVGVVIVTAILLGAGVFYFTQPYSFKGSVITPPEPAADFTLPAGAGQSFTLSEQRGKVVLIFFGYTHCPDACPTTLSVFKQVKKRLENRAENVEFVFITVDPRRDTPEKMASYSTGFDPAFTGLGGSEAELAPVWKWYGVYREVPENPTSDVYEVGHSTFTYVIDKSGSLRETFALGTPADAIVEDVSYLLKE